MFGKQRRKHSAWRCLTRVTCSILSFLNILNSVLSRICIAIVQMNLPMDEVCINSPKTRLVRAIAAKDQQSAVEANLPTYQLKERKFVISPSLARSVGYNMKSVRLTEDVIRTIFDRLGIAKPKRISSLMGIYER